jgi:ribulose-phosphate 3-epimerase
MPNNPALHTDYAPLLQSLGLAPQSIPDALIRQALTHKSVMADIKTEHLPYNERLEFLGDAFLKVSLSQWLYKHLPDVDEGVMTQIRAYAVSDRVFAEVAKSIDLSRYIITGRGLQNVANQDSVLANVFEALCGAMSLALDFDTVSRSLLHLLRQPIERAIKGEASAVKNYKALLQEFTQAQDKNLPIYTVVDTQGPAHERHFIVEVSLKGEALAQGQGGSKRKAEQTAAKAALKKLNALSPAHSPMSPLAQQFFDQANLELSQPDGLYLAPSVLSADFGCLREALESIRLGGAPWVHLDVMDGHFVPNLTIGPPVIKALRKYSRQVFDAHLMMSNPQDYLKDFAEAGCDRVTIHYEATEDPRALLHRIRELGMLPGITVKPDTPVSVLEPLLEDVALVLVMSVEPGFGGQAFMPSALDKIKQLHAWRSTRKLSFLIEVDGGIDENTLPAVIEAGADVVVIGSSVFKTPDPVQTMRQFNQQLKSLKRPNSDH